MKSTRIPYKNELLDRYIKTHDLLLRKDMEIFNYNMLDGILYKYAKRNKIYLKRISYDTWEKINIPIGFEQIKGPVYTKDNIRKITPKIPFSIDEKRDAKDLRWEAFKRKYPKRSRDNYKYWRDKTPHPVKVRR